MWPWLIGPFVEAWVRVRGDTDEARTEARTRFVVPLLSQLDRAGLGHLSEITDAEPPFAPKGCPFQAWSMGELLRLDRAVLHDRFETAVSALRAGHSRPRQQLRATSSAQSSECS